ncbi:V-type ATP synthase subunit B, partial [Halobacteriales archaeon QH_8_67_27]
EEFEEQFVQQGYDTSRDIDETLDIGWDLLSMLPKPELNRIDEENIEEHYREDVEAEVAVG